MAIQRPHYERMIIACALLLLFVNVGFTSTAFSVYQSHIVDISGVGNVGGSFVVTLRTLVALVCMFFTGICFKKINPRIVMTAATFCTAAAFLLFGIAENMAGFCIAAILAGIGYGFGGMVASTYLIGNWFRGKVGSVSGVVAMGSGLAAIVVPIGAGWLIDLFSLPVAFLTEAALALTIAIVIMMFVRTTPYELGLEPIDIEKNGILTFRPRRAKTPKRPKAALAYVPLPRLSYLAMIVAIILLGGVSVAGYNYFGILLTTQGIDLVTAATLISVAGVFLTIAKFLVGIVCDRWGTLFGSCLFFILLVLSLVLCSFVGDGGVPEAALAAVVLGVGMPLGTTGVSLWSLELSSPDKMLKNVRRFQLSYAFGGFAFNMMPGVLCQITGTYTSTYVVLTVMAIICAAMIITVYARHIVRVRRAYEQAHE